MGLSNFGCPILPTVCDEWVPISTLCRLWSVHREALRKPQKRGRIMMTSGCRQLRASHNRSRVERLTWLTRNLKKTAKVWLVMFCFSSVDPSLYQSWIHCCSQPCCVHLAGNYFISGKAQSVHSNCWFYGKPICQKRYCWVFFCLSLDGVSTSSSESGSTLNGLTTEKMEEIPLQLLGPPQPPGDSCDHWVGEEEEGRDGQVPGWVTVATSSRKSCKTKTRLLLYRGAFFVIGLAIVVGGGVTGRYHPHIGSRNYTECSEVTTNSSESLTGYSTIVMEATPTLMPTPTHILHSESTVSPVVETGSGQLDCCHTVN